MMGQDSYEKIMMMAKRRGFIFPSFELYGGCAGFYDYGPFGSSLKNNVENLWRSYFLLRDNCVEVSTPALTLFEVLDASGHVKEFTDLTVDCSKCSQSFKVEDIMPDEPGLLPEDAVSQGRVVCPSCGEVLGDAHDVNLMFQSKVGYGNARDVFLRPETAQGIFTNFHLLYRLMREKLPFGVIQVGRGYRNEISPRQGMLRQREFNMAEAEIFFDPQNKSHPSFSKIEDEVLLLFDNKDELKLSAKDAVSQGVVNNEALAYYMWMAQDFLLSIGIDPKKFRFRKHADDELAHYALECWDVELFSERFGWVECVGIADRSAFDLSAHDEASGVEMKALRKFEEPKVVHVRRIVPAMGKLGPLFKGDAGRVKELLEDLDPPSGDGPVSVVLDGKSVQIPSDCFEIIERDERVAGEKFLPHVVEPSFGVDRIIYMLLEHCFVEEEKNGELYRVLRFPARVAPVKVGVFPLIADEKLSKVASDIDENLRKAGLKSVFDSGGTIGRRYARMDEVGTPFCVTVDFDSLEDEMVTVRLRDTAEQKRIKIAEVVGHLKELVGC